MHHRSPHRGFTLIEVLLALTLVGVLSLLAYSAFGPAFTFYQRMETEARLKDLRTAFERAYQSEEIRIATGAAASLAFAAGTLSPVVPNTNRLCPSTTTTLDPIARYLSTSAARAVVDGHGRGMCILISSPLTTTVGGSTVNYYAVAIVSAGQDGTVHASTALSAAGVLTLQGDDKGYLIDGRALARDRMAVTEARMQRIVDAYSSYFTARYLANVSRDISVDYFANTDAAGSASSRWDTGGSVASSRGASVSMTSISAHTALGLSTSDVTDAWEQVMQIDNSSSAVRNPSNSSSALQAPPYTARISTTVPGGGQLVRTVVGAY